MVGNIKDIVSTQEKIYKIGIGFFFLEILMTKSYILWPLYEQDVS